MAGATGHGRSCSSSATRTGPAAWGERVDVRACGCSGGPGRFQGVFLALDAGLSQIGAPELGVAHGPNTGLPRSIVTVTQHAATPGLDSVPVWPDALLVV